MNKKITVSFLVFICFVVSACSSSPSLVVNSSEDYPDFDTSDGKCKTVLKECTLRAAIMEANISDDESLITFENVTHIEPGSSLPVLTASNTHIDGNGVVLDGINYSDEDGAGLEIFNSSSNIIQGLRFKNFNRGIFIHSDNGSAKYNIIGYQTSDIGDTKKSNEIVLNDMGVEISGQGTSENVISGNFIGVKRDGETARPNNYAGILITNGANNNLIGSLTGIGILQGGNLISGNSFLGIDLSGGDHNHITGNMIGTTQDGNSPQGNHSGIRIRNCSNTYIGFNASGSGSLNLVSANQGHGIVITEADHIFVTGNYIGTDLSGELDLGNEKNGITISNDTFDIVVGGSDDQANLIAFNGGVGIFFDDDGTNNIQILNNTMHSNEQIE